MMNNDSPLLDARRQTGTDEQTTHIKGMQMIRKLKIIPMGSWVLGTLAVLLTALSMAAGAADNPSKTVRTIENIQVNALPGNRAEIRLQLSGEPLSRQPLSFSIDEPARIAFDLPATRSKVARRQAIDIGVARSMSIVSARGRTRLVINVDKVVPYETRLEDNTLAIVIAGPSGNEGLEALPAASTQAFSGKQLPVMPAPASSPSTADQSTGSDQMAADKPVIPDSHRIDMIDFRRGDDGTARIIVTLPDERLAANIEQQGGKLIVDFPRAYLRKDLERRLDVTDFATLVEQIDSMNRPQGARLVIDASDRFEHLAYQAGNVFTLEVKQAPDEATLAARQGQKAFEGDRLSLNFQDINVRAVLQLIADFTGKNLVTSDSVTGKVTLRLKHVPWDQAMDIILKSKGLAMRELDNIILVAPAEEIAAREKAEFEAQQQAEELAPLHSDLIQVNYAKAENIAALLKAKENSMLSKRGSVTIDERTNALLLRDTADKLVEIRKLVSKLDIPVRQVLIESRIVVANDDFSRELGVRFGVTGVATRGSNGSVGLTGSLAGSDSIVASAPNFTTPTLTDRLGVSLPVASPAGKIALSILSSDYLVDLELSAMQAEGRGEVISSPRVITANQTEAHIEQGVEIPYLQAASSGAATISFKKAVLSLKVQPQITPDGHVIMDLAVNKDSVGEIFQGVPSVDTREVQTQVLVDNGETIVLGGIYEQTRSHQVNKVPLLGDLPLIGGLFRQTINKDKKAELLIFVTPKILKGNQAMPR